MILVPLDVSRPESGPSEVLLPPFDTTVHFQTPNCPRCTVRVSGVFAFNPCVPCSQGGSFVSNGGEGCTLFSHPCVRCSKDGSCIQSSRCVRCSEGRELYSQEGGGFGERSDYQYNTFRMQFLKARRCSTGGIRRVKPGARSIYPPPKYAFSIPLQSVFT